MFLGSGKWLPWSFFSPARNGKWEMGNGKGFEYWHERKNIAQKKKKGATWGSEPTTPKVPPWSPTLLCCDEHEWNMLKSGQIESYVLQLVFLFKNFDCNDVSLGSVVVCDCWYRPSKFESRMSQLFWAQVIFNWKWLVCANFFVFFPYYFKFPPPFLMLS